MPAVFARKSFMDGRPVQKQYHFHLWPFFVGEVVLFPAAPRRKKVPAKPVPNTGRVGGTDFHAMAQVVVGLDRLKWIRFDGRREGE